MKEKLHYPEQPYSEKYKMVIATTIAEIKSKLEGYEPIVLSNEQYHRGIDALPDDVRAIAQEAGKSVKSSMDYELSYNQLCIAFFGAAQELGILEVKDK